MKAKNQRRVLMKRVIRSSVTSSRTVNDSNIKASTDNYNPYSFMVGDQLEWSGLYGGEYKGVVTNVTDEYITVDVMWIAEDSGKLVTDTRRFEIATDPEGRECIIVYRYRDTVGYVYPPSNEYINSAEESDVSDWKELASKSVEDSDGFYTDYTLYTDGQTYICMFGDKDLYEPDASYADYETESESDAWEWFNSYTGFADEEDEYDDILYDDILESTQAINSSQYPYRQNDLNYKLDTLYDRACATFGEDLVNKIVVECGGPTPEENPDSWWSDSLDTEKFYHKLTELFLNKMLNYEDFEDASDMDIFAYNCVAEEYDLPTVEDLDSPGYAYDPQKVWEQFRNKITNISSTTGVYYPNGKEVTDIDLDTYLDYNFGTDRDKDNSKYTTEEKQRSVDYWFKKHDTIRGSESTEVVNSGYSPELLNELVNYYRSFDNMSSEEIWDEIVAEYNNEDLANDVLESLDHEEDLDLVDEEGAYDVYSSSDIKASMGRYDEYYGQTAAATYGDLIADRLKGKSVSKRRDTANEPGGLIYEANKLGIDMWDLLEALEGMCNEGRAREMDDSTYKILGASDLADEEDLPQADQEYDSAKTSINSNKLPAIYHMITLPEGSVGIDYGGGKFDNAVEALAEQGVTLHVYDPYNRSQQHNRAAIQALRANGGADFAINSNVLNVIKEPEARLNVLENIKKITKPGAPIYITVYEGSGKGNEGVTKSGYQLNRKTADYLDEIKEVFPDAKRKGKLIIATNSGSANSSTTIKASSTEGYVYTYCDECGKKNRVKVVFNSFNEPFNDTEYKCKYCGTRNLLTDPHSYDENGDVVEVSQSYLDRIEELMEQGLDEDTASREAYAEFYPDDYDADDYDEIYSANYVGASVSNLSFHCPSCHNKTLYSMEKDIRLPIDVDYREIFVCDECGSEFEAYPQYDGSIKFKEYDAEDANASVKASYGGAYDVDPEQYFTKDDLVEFAQDVIDSIANSQDILLEISELSIDGKTITLGLTNESDGGGFEDFVRFNVDMRKIRKPSDLMKYTQLVAIQFIKAYNEAISYDNIESDTVTSSIKPDRSNKTTNSDSNILKEIRDVCYNKLIKIMTSSSFGFDEDEAKDYAFVDTAYDADNYVRIEVRAEVSYNSLVKIAAELDSIIQQYDSEAYFDPEEPGILVALIDLKSAKHKKVNSAYMPEPPIDPPEDDSWSEVDGWIEDVDLDVDAIIEVLDDGSWIYEDETYPWAVSKDSHDGDHYSYEYYVHIGDPGTIVEDFDDVIEKYIPSEEGRYHLKCNATLKYFIEGVEVKQSYYYDERHGQDYDEEVYKDNANVELDEYDSKVENVSVERIW